KSALYNLEGKLLLPAEYDAISYVKAYQDKWQNLLLCHKESKVGLYDIKKGEMILSPEYEIKSISVSNSDAEVFALAKDDILALFDTNGKQISEFKYQEYGGGTIKSEGYAKVQDLNGLWGIVDKNGKEIVPCKYKGMGLSVCNQRIAFQGNNEKWGYLNVSNGEEIVKPIYDRARDFSDGFGEVEKNKKVGFVDINGKVVVPLEYEGALNVQKGICFMMKKGDWFPIRLAENKPINNEKYAGGNFDFLTDFAVISCKSDNILMQGVINTKGETIIACRPTDFGFMLFPQNAVLQEKENSFVIFSLPDGKELIKSTKQPIIEKDFMLVAQNGKYLVTDLRGNKISEIEAASVGVARGYLQVGNKEEEYEMAPPIDASG
ncbi:MAG: WG repeat-containing protein, partial [Raineya sp.]